MKLSRFFSVPALLVASSVYGAGFVHSENFVVFTPAQPNAEAAQRYAQQVLEQAEKYRSAVAAEWLGEELPSGAGRTVINVDFSTNQDRGLTWAKDHPQRKFHNIYLSTSAENAIGCTLHHEIAHAVLATRYPHPHRLPTWLDEGIASGYDDEATVARRELVIQSWSGASRPPRLAAVLELQQMPASDDASYAAATALVNFLLSRADRQTLLQFGEAGGSAGWDAALRLYYSIEGVEQLQEQWQAWLLKRNAAVARLSFNYRAPLAPR